MIKEKLISYEWAIAIYKGETPSELRPFLEASKTALTFEDVNDIKAEFVADPFMILINNLWYMFFEVLNAKSGLGEIGYATSYDCIEWTYKEIVLREKFHLSYPMVFKENQQLYMVPETRQAGEIRLYKATDFPKKWEQEKVLIKGDYADATLFKEDNKWWMFALNGTKNLHLDLLVAPICLAAAFEKVFQDATPDSTSIIMFISVSKLIENLANSTLFLTSITFKTFCTTATFL